MDVQRIAAAFGVSPGAVQDYFGGGGRDPVGHAALAEKLRKAQPELDDYIGEGYVRLLLTACIQCGLPLDQLQAVIDSCSSDDVETDDDRWQRLVLKHTKGGACNFRNAAFEFACLS